MCLEYDEFVDKDIERRLKSTGRVTLWKMVKVHSDGCITSPFTAGKGFEWKSGWNVSTSKTTREKTLRRMTKSSGYRRTVSKGFHMSNSRQCVRRLVNRSWYWHLVSGGQLTFMKVYAFRKHFVVGGIFGNNETSVFSRVFVPKSEINRLKKMINKKTNRSAAAKKGWATRRAKK